MKLDELSWTKVDDDLEEIGDDGFYYGLEELDGVGVENDGGVVKFVPATAKKTSEKAPTKKKPKKKAAKPKDAPKKQASPESVKEAVTTEKDEAENEAEAEDEDNDDEEEEEENEFDILAKIEDDRILTSLGSWPKGLDPRIYKGLDKLGFLDPTPIQAQTIPSILEHRDVIGKAATGSGKTLAYTLPLLQRYFADPAQVAERPEGLIISPTRELAHQIRDHVKAVLPAAEGNKVVALTGGLAIQKQLRQLSANPAIVVATPGRLLEVLEQMSVKQQQQWQKIPSLVLDEADRLVQSGSFAELESVLRIIGISKQRQVLVYSATFNTELWSSLSSNRKRKREEIREIMEQKFGLSSTAEFADADPESKVAKAIQQAVIECPNMEKDLYLYYFLLIYPGKTVAFVNSIDAVKRIVPLLREVGISAVGVHSGMMQKQRLRSLERFKNQPAGVLIATDVAARGLDVPFVDHVVHYHLPRTGDMYIHRSGRTARAGNEGVSVVLSSPQESSSALPNLVKLINSKPQHLDVDFDILEKLRNRIRVAKQIADTQLLATQKGKSQSWLTEAADELGIDVDEDFEKTFGGGDLRGKKSKKKTYEDIPGAIKALRAELAALLQQKLSTNRRYLTSGTENLAQKMLKNPNALIPEKQHKTALEELSSKKKKKPSSIPASASAAKTSAAKTSTAKTSNDNKPTAADAKLSKAKLPKTNEKTKLATKAKSTNAKKQQVSAGKNKPLSASRKAGEIKPGGVAKNTKAKASKVKATERRQRPNGPKGRGKGKTIAMTELSGI